MVRGDGLLKVIERIGDNPLQEGVVNPGHDANAQGREGNQLTNTLILTLLSLNNPNLSTILDNVFRGVAKPSYGRSYFIGLPKNSSLQSEVHFSL